MTEHRIDLAQIIASDRGGHSIFSASGSSLWLNCAGGLIPNLLLPDNAGPDAAYGTVAHGVAETWLKTGKRPDHLIGTNEFVESGTWGWLIDIDEEMLDFVEQCIDWVEWLPGDVFIERRVFYSQITPIPDQGGTLDYAALSPGRAILVDWKFGTGVTVYAEFNSQLMLYALGVFYEFDHIYHFEQFEVRVAQPRINHFDVWVFDRATLLEFAEYAKKRAYAAWVPNAPRSPSEKACMWCKVYDCTAVAKLNIDLTAGAFENLELETTHQAMAEFKAELDMTDELEFAEISKLSTADLAQLAGYRKMAERWWKSVANELYRRAISGEQVPGYKLVTGRSSRVFRNPKVAARHLMSLGADRSQVYVEKMISPNQSEELLRGLGYRTAELQEALEPYWFKPPGKATLVPSHDKRQSVDDLTASVFEDLVNEPKPDDETWSI